MINNLRFVPNEVFDLVAINPDPKAHKPSDTVQYLREQRKNSALICAKSMMLEEWDAINLGTLDPETILILKETNDAELNVLEDMPFENAVTTMTVDNEEDNDDEHAKHDKLGEYIDSLQITAGAKKRINASGWSKKLSKGKHQIQREWMGRKRHNKPAWRKRI